MKYDTLLFDFDGTVINSIEAIVLSMHDTFDHFNLDIPSDKVIKSYIGIPIEKIPYLDVNDKDITREDVIAKYREIYKASYGRTNIYVYDGMKELLERAKSKGMKLGVVSSKTTDPIIMNLEDTDLTGLFDVIIGSDLVTDYKPLPETVFLCAQKIGLKDARKSLVIGDAHHDIEMGQRAGMDTCAVPWGAGTYEELSGCNPTYHVKNMEELSRVVFAKD